jgi:hypothetical protein
MSLLSTKPDSVEIIMITTAVGPTLRKHPETGLTEQCSRVFRAGQKYTVAYTPEIEQWLARRNCYLAGTPQPTDPPVMDPSIHATRRRTPDENLDQKELIRDCVREVFAELNTLLPQQPWWSRVAAWFAAKKSS